MYCKVRIEFDQRADSILFSDAKDEVKEFIGDFSEERLEQLIAEVNRRIRLGWKYMADRRPAPAVPAAMPEFATIGSGDDLPLPPPPSVDDEF